jgi:hypothetical protein
MILLAALMIAFSSLPASADKHPEHDDQAAARTGIEFQPRLGEYHYEIT